MAEVTALAPWFGSARMVAEEIGKELRGLKWVGIPCPGGMSEIMHIDARTIVASDLHYFVINLARVVSDPESHRWLVKKLNATVFHPEQLAVSQEFCKRCEFTPGDPTPFPEGAYHYFITAWMGASAKAGTDREFTGKISTRWTSSGGDSCTRFRSAARALVEWRRVFRRCNFHVMDAFEFVGQVKDEDGHGIYWDAPWPKDGDAYVHKYSLADHTRQRDALLRFKKTRVVVRYGDHPLVRELYPQEHWTWRPLTGRTQGNNDKAEVLIINGPSYATAAKSKLF